MLPSPSLSSGQAQPYYVIAFVSRETDKIVATGCVFIEKKFLRGLGSVGHIEDIAVSKDMQGKKLGLRIIQTLVAISERVGCYKTILNCSDDNIREFSFHRPSLNLDAIP
jgi:glucosamine-phosphate N-acetyltransferase